jgi:hypothetical protein
VAASHSKSLPVLFDKHGSRTSLSRPTVMPPRASGSASRSAQSAPQAPPPLTDTGEGLLRDPPTQGTAPACKKQFLKTLRTSSTV